MYYYIYSMLPGPRWAKVLESVALIAAVVALLLLFVFPWLSDIMTSPSTVYGN